MPGDKKVIKKRGRKKRKTVTGRPPIVKRELDFIFQKLEPHLKTGKTLNKACLLAKVPKSSVYKYYGLNEEFTEKVDAAMSYVSVLINDNFFSRLVEITKKVEKVRNLNRLHDSREMSDKQFNKEIAAVSVTDSDWGFLKWYSLNSHSTRGEYGTRVEMTGKGGQALIPEGILDQKPIETLLESFKIIQEKVNEIKKVEGVKKKKAKKKGK